MFLALWDRLATTTANAIVSQTSTESSVIAARSSSTTTPPVRNVTAILEESSLLSLVSTVIRNRRLSERDRFVVIRTLCCRYFVFVYFSLLFNLCFDSTDYLVIPIYKYLCLLQTCNIRTGKWYKINN